MLIIIAPNAHRLLRVYDFNEFMTFFESPHIFVRICKLQCKQVVVLHRDVQLCIFHEAQHNKNIALYEHIKIRAGKCRISAVPSGFYSTVYLTLQCSVQCIIVYNTVQCAMQTQASHTILWTLYNTMCNAVYRPVHQTVILQHNVSYSPM